MRYTSLSDKTLGFDSLNEFEAVLADVRVAPSVAQVY